MTEIVRAGADPGAEFLDGRLQPDAIEVTHAVRSQEDAGADFAEGRGLLADRDVKTVRDQGICREQAADTSTDDNNRQSHCLTQLFRRSALAGSGPQGPFRHLLVQAILSR